MQRRYCVYILTNKSRTLYTGVTSNLPQRLQQHQSKAVPGFTAKYNINRLVFYEEWATMGEAIAREKQIKGWRRDRKVALIESANPLWEDLAEHVLG